MAHTHKKMPKTYKGRIRIVCEGAGSICPGNIQKDVVASCAGCELSRVEIIGLKDELFYRIETKKQEVEKAPAKRKLKE